MSSQPTPENKLADPFLLDKVFPSAKNVFLVRPPSVESLSGDCAYVLDTNVLIAPYTFGQKQADDISRIFKRLAEKSRLFVPVRAAQEFARLRSSKLEEMYNKIHQWKSKIGSLTDTSQHLCPVLEGRDAYNRMIAASESLIAARTEYDTALGDMLKELHKWEWQDPISLLYAELFNEDRLIAHNANSESDREAILSEMRSHYANMLPPGYKDQSKPDEGIGDFLIWLSMLEFAKKSKKNIVFVSGEEKRDWVIRTQNRTLGIRPELFYMFLDKTGYQISISSFPHFLKTQDADPITVREARTAEMDGYDWMIPMIEEILDMRTSVEDMSFEIDRQMLEINSAVTSQFEAYRTSLRQIQKEFKNRDLPEITVRHIDSLCTCMNMITGILYILLKKAKNGESDVERKDFEAKLQEACNVFVGICENMHT